MESPKFGNFGNPKLVMYSRKVWKVGSLECMYREVWKFGSGMFEKFGKFGNIGSLESLRV